MRLCASILLSVLLFLVSPAFAQLGKPEVLYYKSWAVVIGINDYLVAPKLQAAVGNAKAMADTLRKLGFDEVVELYDKDASFRRLSSIFNDYLPRKVGRQDRVVIYFAGHSGITKDMNGKDLGHMVPWDAPTTNAAKGITMDELKASSRRVMAKHILFLLDTGISGWDVTPPQQLSLEGRIAPEAETERRAVQILTAGGKGEPVKLDQSPDPFVDAIQSGVSGAADQDKNGWLLASELAGYVGPEVEKKTAGAQHPQYAKLDGEGDTILIEGSKTAFKSGREPKTEAERAAAAKEQYDQAFTILQEQRSIEEALTHLNKALEYNPAFGDAYVLKSYLYLEMAQNLPEALTAAKQAVKYAPQNPDSTYTLGLVLQRQGQYADAEKAMRQALEVNPNYSDVYLSLGDLYAEDLKDRAKAAEAYRRHLETGGQETRARAFVEKNGAEPAVKQ
jgi:tetratricopeptide (TPR) repeat protein